MDDFREALLEEGYEVGDAVADDHWGTLYRASYRRHGRGVLLRRFPDGLICNEDARELLFAEVQVWARLRHRGVVQVLDWGTARAHAFVAMESPGGVLLADSLDAGLQPQRAEAVFTTMLECVEAARKWGVLHLGLWPGCVWVEEEGAVKVSDFGLWYVTREFAPLGARDDVYLAPEQKEGREVTAATDVYSLAVLYVSMLLGAGGAVEDMEGTRAVTLAACLDEAPLARPRSAGELATLLGSAEDAAEQAARKRFDPKRATWNER